MKNRTVGILLGMLLLSVTFGGCGGGGEATETAGESAAIADESSEAEGEETEDSEEADGDDEEILSKIGIILSDENSQVCKADAELLKTAFEGKEYEVLLSYAKGNDSEQEEQIRALAEQGVAALVIEPVNAYGLTDVLNEISESGIPVFSYDELIMDTIEVDYFVTFDQRKTGQSIGQAIEKQAELEKAREEKQPKTIEFLMGSTDDLDALFLYNGVMEVLQPYFDDGTLVCRSNQSSFDAAGILRWSSDAASRRFSSILGEYYSDGVMPDIVCTGFDGAACSAVQVLQDAGIENAAESWPLITGVGCEDQAVQMIAEEKIFGSVFFDRQELAESCVKIVDAVVKGEEVEVNNKEQYDNGKKVVSANTCDGQLITKDDYEMLIDRGIYTEKQGVSEQDAPSLL